MKHLYDRLLRFARNDGQCKPDGLLRFARHDGQCEPIAALYGRHGEPFRVKQSKIARALLVLLILSAHTLFGADKAYKILVNSYQTQSASDAALVEIRSQVEATVPASVREVQGYDFHSRKLGKFFVVTIEPLYDQELIQKLLKVARKEYRDAFVSSSKMPRTSYEKVPVPVIDTVSKAAETLQPETVSEPEPDIQATSAAVEVLSPIEVQPDTRLPATNASSSSFSAEERARYFRNPQKLSSAEAEDDTVVPLILGGSLILLLILGLGYFFMRQRKHADDALSEYLMEEASQSIQERAGTPFGTETKIKIDIHSHLIPGIDDGSKSIEESLELVEKLHALGYTKLITTPHIASNRYPNTTQIIQGGLKQLRDAVEARGIAVTLEAAAEYFLDDHFMTLLEQRDLLTFGGNFLLFEMSYVNHPAALFEMVEAMKDAGYKPVLAHPERYLYLAKSFEKYERLKQMGVFFQLNLNSLMGYYSPEVRDVAMKLSDRGMVDFVGSDTHKMRQVLTLESVFDAPVYAHLLQRNRLLNNLL